MQAETTAPGDADAPAGAQSEASRRLLGALEKGGLWWFLALFLGGLALNLTPCVFPMLGITVSVFGARRRERPVKVLAHAVAYVLGIAVTYSVLGVVAALTGGLFGSALQNPLVNVGLGLLFIVLSLSMFGLYEMQPPTWVLQRLGGADATSLLGIFLSGLAVGIIAAPCVGPFVVAVLALLAQRGDALFGFQTMFAMSLGLGLPYLFLALFSNLIQSLPRSGDWMLWVKKVFGILLAAIGLYYALIGLAPRLAPWILPAALVLGGLYLGFVDRHGSAKRGFRVFKRALGVLAVLASHPGRDDAARRGHPLPALRRGGDAGRARGGPARDARVLGRLVRALPRTRPLDLHRPQGHRALARLRGLQGGPDALRLARLADAARALRRDRRAGDPVLRARRARCATARVIGFIPPGPFLAHLEMVLAGGRPAGSSGAARHVQTGAGAGDPAPARRASAGVRTPAPPLPAEVEAPDDLQGRDVADAEAQLGEPVVARARGDAEAGHRIQPDLGVAVVAHAERRVPADEVHAQSAAQVGPPVGARQAQVIVGVEIEGDDGQVVAEAELEARVERPVGRELLQRELPADDELVRIDARADPGSEGGDGGRGGVREPGGAGRGRRPPAVS